LTGLTNAVLNRVKYLDKISDYRIDVYDILSYPFGLSHFFFPKSKYSKKTKVSLEGVDINILWYKNILIDSIFNFKIHRKPFFLDGFIRKKAHIFKYYDLISAHAFVGAKMAYQIHNLYGTPFCVTWHGSEIHSIPHVLGSYQFEMTKKIMEVAACNFFVSKALEKSSSAFSNNITSQLLYNGVNELFYRFPEERRLLLKQKYQVMGKKVVAFVGNLKPVKNASLLPDIFDAVNMNYSGGIEFWIIGEGEERAVLEQKISKMSAQIKLWGYQNVSVMPEILQCVDVLILPSKNEGLGMVLLEAIACGAKAVGSNSGGISEVVGKENAIPLGENFVNRLAKRIVYFLENDVHQDYPVHCSWTATAKREKNVYDFIMVKKNEKR